MPPFHTRSATLTLILLMIVVLNACGQRHQQANVPPHPLPTAQVAPLAPLDSDIFINELPALATPSSTPLPTRLPPPPTPTVRPVGPGDLAFPLQTERLEYGAVAHLFYTNRTAPLGSARDAGFGWVRQQIHWKDQEGPAGNYVWGEFDQIVQAVNAYDLKLLVSIVQSPSFYTLNGRHGMPANPQNLGDFVAALARQYQGRIHAIEIWNEQNLAVENGGQVSLKDAGHYVELLKEAYTRIKEVDPSIYVIAGAPASTATNAPGVAVDDMSYYRAMYTYQNGIIRNYMDAQGVHPGGSANPPDTLWPENPSLAQGWTEHETFYFRHIENVRRLMEAYGAGDHQIWITEFGWATANNTPGYEFGNQISYELQAEYIVNAMRQTKEQYPWVGAIFLWNLNFAPLKARDGNAYHEQASFGILNPDYSPRPAYWAIQQHIGEVRAGR